MIITRLSALTGIGLLTKIASQILSFMLIQGI